MDITLVLNGHLLRLF